MFVIFHALTARVLVFSIRPHGMLEAHQNTSSLRSTDGHEIAHLPIAGLAWFSHV
jgi:hypothetical protein